MVSLQSWFAPRGFDKIIDNTEEVEKSIIVNQESSVPELDDEYWSRLIKSEENPGWLWDPMENEWVADPAASLGGDE
jgi:hypothetical protein